MQSNVLFNTKQAALYLGVSAAFLERDRWAGARIPFVKLGTRSIRYRVIDLEDFVAGSVRTSTVDQGSGHA
ncbi:MAG: helix-turn-helix domain-containing protein [Gammaproteobacteria bacterium]|nr:helix-turn-helix domain-containing protein [Gammaproteobacteria bacterium]MDP2349065.1 helix-turn-helix domain-containing protein [Gammaproteobacteria bacterium]